MVTDDLGLFIIQGYLSSDTAIFYLYLILRSLEFSWHFLGQSYINGLVLSQRIPDFVLHGVSLEYFITG